MPEKDINRQVEFNNAPAFNPEDSSGVNNNWIYNRAPEGYLFYLQKIDVSTSITDTQRDGIIQIYDGHAYTHWNIYPGVEDREILGRIELNSYQINNSMDLMNWVCKEYTIGVRSTSVTYGFKVASIVWYYLKKASRKELLEYALKHPVRQDTFKRALRGSTVEPEEA